MRIPTAGITALMILFAPVLIAQGGEGNRRTPIVSHAFDRIEKSLKELEAIVGAHADKEIELLAAIRDRAAELRKLMSPAKVEPQILYEIRLIDLEAKGAMEAWKSRFGTVPDEPRELPEGAESKLEGFPGLIAAPHILAVAGQKAEISVGEEHDIFYLKRLADGTYAAKETRVNDGLSLSITGASGSGASIDLEIAISVHRIVGKTEYERGAPTVGWPLLSRRSGRTRGTLAAGIRHAIMPIDDGEESIVIIVLAKPLTPDQAPQRAR